MRESTVKERLARKALKVIDKRLITINHILDANPLSEICDLRLKAHAILVEHKGDGALIAKLIEPLAIKEKQLFALAKKQEDSTKLINEKVRLESERVSLANELFIIEKKGKGL